MKNREECGGTVFRNLSFRACTTKPPLLATKEPEREILEEARTMSERGGMRG